MAPITSLYVHKVVAQASPGVRTDDLVAALGIDPAAPIDPAIMVPSADYYRFFAALAARDPNGLTLPLKIGAAMRSDEYGAFGLAWKSAPNLLGSYQRSERYGRVLGSAETYSLHPAPGGMFYALDKAGDGSLGMCLSNEASLSAVVTISAEVSTAPFVPLSVHFKHAPRGEPAIYEAHFGCPVEFEADHDAILVCDAILMAPNRLGDETIAQFFDRHLETEIAAQAKTVGESTEPRLDEQVRDSVSRALSGGVPTLSDVAKSLGMSGRTLQRRLSENGLAFQAIVDRARRQLAQKLLRETSYSLAEIAFLTGFADQSGFTRAFKRWSGETPRSYRIATSRT